jgi:putative membrane protein
VQSIRIERPLLWRRFGWARVEVDVAGADAKAGASLMPVADDPVAVALASDVAGEPIEPPGGVEADWGARLTPPGPRARLIDPLTASWLGVSLLDHGAVTRTGAWERTVTYVPFARVQSVSVRQGWLQRRFGLATVCLDLPSGATRWVAPHRDVAEAAFLVQELTQRARSHRAPLRAPASEQVLPR